MTALARRCPMLVAGLLALNGVIGCVALLAALLFRHADPGAVAAGLVLSLSGLAAGLLAWRRQRRGWLLGVIYTAPQTLTVYAPRFHFSLNSGFSLALTINAPGATIMVNLAALALFAATLAFWLTARAAAPESPG